MKRRCRAAGAGLLVGVFAASLAMPQTLFAQAAAGQPAAADQPTRVRLVFDEQLIGDQVRAQVYGLIAASVPLTEWPTLELAETTDVTAVLKQYYELYSTGVGAAPQTQRVVTDMIARANPGRVSGGPGAQVLSGTITMPPLPIKAYADYRKLEVASRRFDPASMTYEMISDKGAKTTTRGDAVPLAKETPTLRRGRVTETIVSLNEDVRARLRVLNAAAAPMIAIDEDGLATMTLLSSQAATCEKAGDWLSNSPYFAAMRIALTAVSVAALQSAAANVPLTVIDWNVAAETKGHGAKVRAVVKELLNALGLGVIEPNVSVFELNPVRNRGGLKTVLAAYKQHLAARAGSDIDSVFADAETWVETHVPADENALTQRVPSLVLQAVFWNHLRTKGAVNFSFTTDSAALTVLDANFMIGAKGFGVLAAGNSGSPVSPLRKPQAEAFQWSNVVNVTHGRSDGVIDGDISNDRFKIVVNLIAPGCGYVTPPLDAADIGSSFASPYVATAAWIRMLQGVPVTLLKRSLISASLPIVSVGKRVESGGVFDLALLLLQPGSHLLTPDRAFLTLSDLRFRMEYEADGLAITITNPPPQAGQEPTYAVAFHTCGNTTELCTTVRRWLPDGTLFLTSGRVKSFTFEAQAGEQRLAPADAAALLQLARLITF